MNIAKHRNRTKDGKICTRCLKFKLWADFPMNKIKWDGHAYECRVCNNERVRKSYYKDKTRSREATKLSIKRYPEKWKSRGLVSTAIRWGRMKKLPCQKCGETKVQAHHPDYSKPLEVLWLCIKHHMELHRKVTTKPLPKFSPTSDNKTRG